LLLPDCDEEQGLATAWRVLRGLAADECEYGQTVTFSVGVATSPVHGSDRAELMRVADIALYRAKGEGKNRVCAYHHGMPALTQLGRGTDGPDRSVRLSAAAGLGHAVDARDPYVGSHSQRVGELAAAIATRLGLDREQIELVRLAGTLHDLGKLAVSADI